MLGAAIGFLFATIDGSAQGRSDKRHAKAAARSAAIGATQDFDASYMADAWMLLPLLTAARKKVASEALGSQQA